MQKFLVSHIFALSLTANADFSNVYLYVRWQWRHYLYSSERRRVGGIPNV